MNEYLRKMLGRSLWGLLGVGLIIIVVWSLLTHFLPSGWWITLINVLGFLLTTVIIGLGTWQALKLVISSGIAFLIAVLIWAAMVIGLRTLILTLLGD
jgi:hypothetical protein